MGVKVGITIMRGSKTGKTTNNSSRTGRFGGIVAEGLKERWGKDPDINKELTINNEYSGIDSALKLLAEIDNECKAYNAKRKANGQRSLKSDAIIGFAAIVKPPIDWINSLRAEERKKFFADSDEIIFDIMGGYEDDNGDYISNIRATALHRDEVVNINGVDIIGEHKHYYGMPYTSDGRICARDLINLKLFKRFNSEYPRRMRDKGWDIDDMVVYDMDEAAKDPDYKERIKKERAEKREKHGVESMEYKERKRIENAVKAKEAEIEVRIRAEFEAKYNIPAPPAATAPEHNAEFDNDFDCWASDLRDLMATPITDIKQDISCSIRINGHEQEYKCADDFDFANAGDNDLIDFAVAKVLAEPEIDFEHLPDFELEPEAEIEPELETEPETEIEQEEAVSQADNPDNALQARKMEKVKQAAAKKSNNRYADDIISDNDNEDFANILRRIERQQLLYKFY